MTEVTVTLSKSAFQRLREEAGSVGKSVEIYAGEILMRRLPQGCAEADVAFEEYDRTGESVDAEVALAAFQRRVVARVGGA